MRGNFGTFEAYTPDDLPDDNPRAGLVGRILFWRNVDGLDFYDVADANPPEDGVTWFCVRDGHVVSVAADPSMLAPEGCELMWTDEAVAIGDAVVS